MNNRTENNMEENTCIPKKTMIGYINSTLDKKSFLNVSSHLEGCEYCSEAFNGLKQLDDFTVLNTLPLMWQKTTGIKTPSHASFNISGISLGIISVAVIVSSILLLNNNKNNSVKKENAISEQNKSLSDLKDEIKEKNKADEQRANSSEKENIKSDESISGKLHRKVTNSKAEIENKIPGREAFLLNENYTPEINISAYHKSAASEIIYLENLKTISYSEKYSKSQSKLEGILNHVVAQYENKDQQDKKQKELQKNTYAVSYEKALSNGLRNYNKGLYPQAVTDFDMILAQFPKDLNCKFYKALCFENTGKFSMGEKLFFETMTDEDNAFFEEAKWHLAISKIKLEEITDAKNLLKQIISENGFYKPKAEALLKELK